jgi:flagellar biosynthesis protein FlhB
MYVHRYTSDGSTNIALAMNETIVSLFIIIYGFLGTIFTFGLCFYHTTLISSNQTTKEELKNNFRNNFGNPYDKGFKYNVRDVFLPRLSQPSLLDMIRYNIGRDKIVPHVYNHLI